jgi:hypothetical protein
MEVAPDRLNGIIKADYARWIDHPRGGHPALEWLAPTGQSRTSVRRIRPHSLTEHSAEPTGWHVSG